MTKINNNMNLILKSFIYFDLHLLNQQLNFLYVTFRLFINAFASEVKIIYFKYEKQNRVKDSVCSFKPETKLERSEI